MRSATLLLAAKRDSSLFWTTRYMRAWARRERALALFDGGGALLEGGVALDLEVAALGLELRVGLLVIAP